MTTRDGDLSTVLRHLFSQTQWGGNQGEKAECAEALDRITSNDYDQGDDNDPNDPDPNAKEPAVGEGSRPGAMKTANATKSTGTPKR